MNVETLYAEFTIVVSVVWLLLLVAPKWSWTERIAHRIWLPIAIAAWAVSLQFLGPPVPEGAGMGTIRAVMLLTQGPYGTLTLWTLLMGWDLLAGAWLARDAQRLNIHHAWVALSLLATFGLGIAGFALYLVIRYALRRETSMREGGR